MNTVRILKDNTDHMNDRDKHNALVEGCSASVNPLLATSVTALDTASTLDDYLASGSAFNNTGAAAAVEHNLPDPATCTGVYFGFFQTAAQITRLQPISGGKVYYGGSGVADKYVQLAGVIGNYMILWCDGVNWYVVEANGVVTKEA